MKPGLSPVLTSVDPAVILERYLSDESTASIAAAYGVTPQALGKHLLKHAEQEWQECQVARALARKEQATEDLDNLRSGKLTLEDGTVIPADNVSLACARERLKSAQWELERVCKRIYGQTIDVKADLTLTVQVIKSGRIIEATDNQSAALPTPSIDESGS